MYKRTTAELRETARIAARDCRFRQAARLMEMAIARYPANLRAGQLYQKDITMMKAEVRGWLLAAEDQEVLPTYAEYIASIKNAA